jgi:peptidoglycan DL-endopeptidase CwlO
MDGLSRGRALWNTAVSGRAERPAEGKVEGLVRVRARRLGPVLLAVAALGVGAAFIVRPAGSHVPDAPAAHRSATHDAVGLGSDTALARALLGRNGAKWPAPASIRMPGHDGSAGVEVASTTAASSTAIAPLGALRPADLLVVAPGTLSSSLATAIGRLHDVTEAQRVDAASIKMDGQFIQMLGVDPSSFRAFAARPTARATALWRNVAAGQVAVSYEMGQQTRLKLGGQVQVAGQRTESLRVGGFGTVGISGVDAVVSDPVAASLGLPADNAIVISAPHAKLTSLMARIKRLLPRHAAIAQLVTQSEPGEVIAATAVTAGAAGSSTPLRDDGPPITPAQIHAFLKAALSRVGDPYIWGAAGPKAFDCSGLVQWSMRQAGITMPRVAVDQATTGPQVPLSELQPGDLLFYHTDPTAPTYISPVAIYLGHGLMEQAPEPGMDVQVVEAVFGAGFAGAVQVYPDLAAAVAQNLAG